MTNQKIVAGGYLDLLTKDELKESMGHSMDSAIQKFYRGIDYLSFAGQGNGLPVFTIPWSPESGYAWSIKLISAQINANTSLLGAYIGSSNTGAAIGYVQAPIGGTQVTAVMRFSSNQVVIKDGQSITLFNDTNNASGTILAYQLRVQQVPIEMQGKL